MPQPLLLTTQGPQHATDRQPSASRAFETKVKCGSKIFETATASQPFVSFPVIRRRKLSFGAENSGFSLTRPDNFALLLTDNGAIQNELPSEKGGFP